MQSTENHKLKNHIITISDLNASSNYLKVLTMYWLPKLYKNQYNIGSFKPLVSCIQLIVQCFLTSTFTIIKECFINFSITHIKKAELTIVWSVNNLLMVLLILVIILAILHTALLDILIKQQFCYLIKWSFGKSKYKYICCKSFEVFFCNERGKCARYTYQRCTKMI